MTCQSITFIISPFHVGQYQHRVGNGPERILQWNLIPQIEELGVSTHLSEISPVDDFEGEIGRSFEILRRTSRLVSEAKAANSFPIVLSGNCMATVGVICGLGVRDLGVVYFDAHDDMDTPSTNDNGYLDAMGLTMLAEQSFHKLWKTVPGSDAVTNFKFDKFIYCGLRASEQVQELEKLGCDVIRGDAEAKVDFAERLTTSIQSLKEIPTAIHLDLDVLDESVGKVNGYETPGGLMPDELIECLGLVARQTKSTSLTVCSFNPNLGSGHKIARIAVEGIVKFVQGLIDKGTLDRTGEQ